MVAPTQPEKESRTQEESPGAQFVLQDILLEDTEALDVEDCQSLGCAHAMLDLLRYVLFFQRR